MALTAVLIDQARILRKAAAGPKVGGRTTFVETEPGTWFPARLMLPQAEPETLDPRASYKRVIKTPTLICDTEDDNGDPVDVRYSDIVEVVSEDLGHDTWQVTAAAYPFRKREGIVGYSFTLRKIDVEEYVPR